MSETPGQKRIERVCVVLDPGALLDNALDTAANLAAELDAELAGFFIEDVNVLRAASLSFTRELGLASGTSRPMELESVKRALRAQAQALESTLARMAEALQLRWSFKTLRGVGLEPMLEATDDITLTVIAPRSALREASATSLRGSRAKAADAHPVAVLYDGSGEALDAFRVAARVASSRSAPLAVFLRASNDTEAKELRERLHQASSREIPGARYLRLPKPSPARTAAMTRQIHAAALVISDGGRVEHQLPDLLLRLDCPVVLVKSGHTG